MTKEYSVFIHFQFGYVYSTKVIQTSAINAIDKAIRACNKIGGS